MASGKKGAKQPILSLILFAVLGAIAVSILSIHSAFIPAPPPAFLEDSPVPSVHSSTAHSFTLSSPPQFEKAGPSEKYDSEGLFEKINGKAPLYLNAGFIELQSQRFVHKDDSHQWFEFSLYDMAADTNAFSVFSTQRRPDGTISPSLFAYEHYHTENGLYLQLGRYYIECVGSSESALLKEGMVKTVLALLAENTIKTTAIAELNLFAKEGLSPHTLKLYLADVFGSEALTHTFVGQYIIDDLPITGFISKQKSSEQAVRVGHDYYQFLIDSGGTPLVDGDGKIKYLNLFGTIESIFQTGIYVAGVHEADNLKNAQIISSRLLKRLQSQISP